ncbi:methanethiol S-methyltransferase [Catellatospora bangladeshensis]|uniref:methanethiol S-methyltransferase n=1 Tax=Catellatospora bangladeshensis TaxID=310355 RepID=A0A8J3JNL0_9ACTN|nr:methanethiol S-methyltransferase [Catellatospora bangladeshensis]GIF82008.1 membrane protein [Catellatospora bangladeshensis]
MSRRILTLGYGVIAYVTFLAVFCYTMGWLGGIGVPKGIDDGRTGPVWAAVLTDAGLLGLFAVQHSVMARPWFKRWWTRLVPQALERSTYVLIASLVIAVLMWQWRPLPGTVWEVSASWAQILLWALYAAGWAVLVLSTFLIGHFDLFGLRQALARVRQTSYAEPGFRQPLLYRVVRHPIMVGFLIAFWAAPHMSAGRLLFALAGTGYILVAVRFEEADLRRQLGEPYRRYAEQVPRFIPSPRTLAGRRPAPQDRDTY